MLPSRTSGGQRSRWGESRTSALYRLADPIRSDHDPFVLAHRTYSPPAIKIGGGAESARDLSGMSGIIEFQRLAEARIADRVWPLRRDEIIDPLGRKQRKRFSNRAISPALDA